ncbi:MAG TPA: phage major capsid protein [Bacteroidales bacterium]|nr:phage major capsid protein [Bacteroidales bacterium]HUX96322.1 phage major capsid protein [Bacteroidales bacterium]
MKFKVNNTEVDYVFKHINIPEKDHGLDDGSLVLLMKIDEGLVKSKGDYNKVQEQLNALFVQADPGNRPYISERKYSNQEVELTKKWVKTFLQKKDPTPIALELKQFTDYMNIADGESGGYLVPELLANEINHFVEQGGVARREMRYMPFNGAGSSRVLPTESAGITVQWLDEGESKPLSNIEVGKVTQTLKKVAAIAVLTEELAEDSGVDLIAYLAQRIGEAILTAEDDQFFAGTGTPWTGILNTAGVVNLSLAPGVGPLTMRPESLLALINSVPSGAMAGGKFYMHRQVWAAICARRADAVAEGDTKGSYLVQFPGQGTPPTIWGYPVVTVEALPSLADLGYASDPDNPGDCDPDEPFLIFANLQKTCVYGDKNALRVKLLDQATLVDENEHEISLAQSDMLAVRVHKRVGYCTVLPAGIAVLSSGPAS